MLRLLSVLASAIVLMACLPVHADYEMAEMPVGQQMAMGQPMPMGQGPAVMEGSPSGAPMQPMPPMQMMEPMPGYQLPASAGYRPKPLDGAVYAPTGAPSHGRQMMRMGPKQISKCKAPMCMPMPQACGPIQCGPPMCMPPSCPQPVAWY